MTQHANSRSPRPRIVITGAAGSVGTALRPQLLERGYQVHATDIRSITPADGETAAVVDIADRDRLAREFQGAHAVVHLAACTDDADWSWQVRLSVEGTINTFEAARAAGVERVIYASSNHVVGLHPRPSAVPPLGSREVLRPDSRYGVAKAFGESVGAMFAYKYGLRVLAMRIGNVADRPIDRRRLGLWLRACEFFKNRSADPLDGAFDLPWDLNPTRTSAAASCSRACRCPKTSRQ